MDFEKINSLAAPLCGESMRAARAKWDGVAKPLGSLGRFEEIVTRIAGIFGTPDVRIDKKGVLVLCGDNGVLARGVAMTPGEVTAIMAEFIADGRSSVCRMAEIAGADVMAVDMGMFRRVNAERLLDRRVADGTNDFTGGPAMTREQALQAISTGVELVKSRAEQGYKILATGEMGIGNTTTSSAITAVLLGLDPRDVTGRGVGLSDEGLARKISAVEKAILVNSPDKNNALDVLQKLGGFDIAGLAGVFIGGVVCRIPIVIDGFISSVSALLAAKLCSRVADFIIPSHVSAEPAGGAVLNALRLEPFITAGMRLGEGTGAVCMFPLLDMALSVYHTACTYADIEEKS
ncbi:MAG: nicotinate-nucleotide--dimethylbenzimidazole phosphoribosyltransferase [Acidobacteriota bacterium]|jgi:nicotinate-nucleotide--dimethylbenzimidazole phosphoribosyltransferase|nr:nicotinate-nucleotide--dimethylbenzimidazole phosphoribosyltransferase [Acidobacteriota bacterium]